MKDRKDSNSINENDKRMLSSPISPNNENKNSIRRLSIKVKTAKLDDVLRKESDEDNKLSINDSHSHKHHKNSFTPYLLLIALSFHGLFEGLALGLQKSAKGTISLMVAILGHKWAESLTLGLSFSKTSTERNTFIKMITIFSLFTPLGIGLGMILNNIKIEEWVQCLFMSLTVGTFIYIAASEIIVEEFSVSRYKWIKVISLLFGLLLISLPTVS